MTIALSRRLRSTDLRLAVPHSETHSATLLLTALLTYGAVMMLLSGVATGSLVAVIDLYAPIAFDSVILVAAVTAAICLVSRVSARRMTERFFWLGVGGVMVWLMLPFFGLFKQLILPHRGFVWDHAFAHVGSSLWGIAPWQITHAVFGSTAGTRFLDDTYDFWMVLMFAFPMAIALLFDNRIVRFRLMVSWFGAWVLIGTVAAWVFASAGPCYYNALVGPDASYAELQRHLAVIARSAAAEGHPIGTLRFQTILLKAFRLHEYEPAGGISAMPSMHVAMATLMAIAGFCHSRMWGLLMTVYALLIWIASIHFGWHYFIDGPVAAVMMIGVWKLTAPLATAAYAPPRRHR